MWADAFFFRAAAMSPPGMKLVLHIEHSTIPSNSENQSDTVEGHINYTAILTSKKHAGKLTSEEHLFHG